MFRAEVKVISRRGVGGNAKALAAVLAYRLGSTLVDPNGRAWDYTGKGSVVATECKGFPDPQAFCDAVEAAEKRKDSQLGREAVLSVDRRLDPAAARRCLAIWTEANLDRHRLPWTAALHSPKSLDRQRNPHFHVVWSDRPVEGNGLGLKRRLTTNEQAEQLTLMRASWAALQNQELEAAGHQPDLTHLRGTVAEKGLGEPKMGSALGEVRRKGVEAAPEPAVAIVMAVRDLRRERKRKRRQEARKRPQEAIAVAPNILLPDEHLPVAAPAVTPSEVPAPAVALLAQGNVADAPSRGATLRPSMGESGSPPSDHADPGRRGPQRSRLRQAVTDYRQAEDRRTLDQAFHRLVMEAFKRYRIGTERLAKLFRLGQRRKEMRRNRPQTERL